MLNKLFSLVSLSWGNGGFIITSPSDYTPPSPPPYGTVLSTSYSVDYEVGGTAYSSYLATFVFTQTCNVDIMADGAGGSFIAWYSATLISYKPNGTHIADGPNIWFNSIEVPTGSGLYYNTKMSDDSEEVHDGMGGTVINPIGWDTMGSAGHLIYTYDDPLMSEIPTGSSNYWANGKVDVYKYVTNQFGTYDGPVYDSQYGDYHPVGTEVSDTLRFPNGNIQTEVPSGSMMYWDNGTYYIASYVWNGSGGNYIDGAFVTGGSYYSYGDFIYNDGMNDYYWDGYGGYYT